MVASIEIGATAPAGRIALMGKRKDEKKAGAKAPENLPLWGRQGEKPKPARMLGMRASVDAPKARGVRPVYLLAD